VQEPASIDLRSVDVAVGSLMYDLPPDKRLD
jgi:hypothetical protein